MVLDQMGALPEAPACAHMLENCGWKEQVQMALDWAHEQVDQAESFYNNNNLEEYL